jgi:hypothetical protein
MVAPADGGPTPEVQSHEMDRREFVKRSAKFALGLALAGSLGAVIGCGTEQSPQVNSNSSSQDAGTSTGTQVPMQNGQSASGSQAPSQPSNTAAAGRCHFYSDGTCERTGQACTDCIDR